MSWAIGDSTKHNRIIGYGVPCICEHPNCNKKIDRGLSYICGGDIDGGEHGCGLFFCAEHLLHAPAPHEAANDDADYYQLCNRCANYKTPYTIKPDCFQWVYWILTDESWHQWRVENKENVHQMRIAIKRVFAHAI